MIGLKRGSVKLISHQDECLGLIWLIAAIVCGVSGNFPMMGLYLVLAGVFLYSAYATWKKEKDGKGGR